MNNKDIYRKATSTAFKKALDTVRLVVDTPVMEKVIIAGGRDFSDFTTLKMECIRVLRELNVEKIEIVVGGAKGADALGDLFAKVYGFPIKRFPADWNTHGKAAGPIRNRQMAAYADRLIVFWDGKSKGTKNMIEEAKKRGLTTHVYRY